MTDDRAKAETRVTCTGCGAELDRYATECSKCECSGCDKPIAHCECSDQPEPLDIRQAEERAQKILYQRRRQESVALAQDYLALLKFTREELVPALKKVDEMAVSWEPLTPGDISEVRAVLSRAREMGLTNE
jgi:hypothetical protein